MHAKKSTKMDLLLSVLSDGDWHWGDELATKVSWRFGAAIGEARKRGNEIQTDRIGLKHRYRLQ
jgi:hypothetical protein